MTKEKVVCSECGSEEIVKDAYASWNIETQQFELHSTYDSMFCQNEEGGCSYALNSFDQKGEWIEVEETQQESDQHEAAALIDRLRFPESRLP